jgi:hypothetical protein
VNRAERRALLQDDDPEVVALRCVQARRRRRRNLIHLKLHRATGRGGFARRRQRTIERLMQRLANQP